MDEIGETYARERRGEGKASGATTNDDHTLYLLHDATVPTLPVQCVSNRAVSLCRRERSTALSLSLSLSLLRRTAKTRRSESFE
jgi:hypothetical protein